MPVCLICDKVFSRQSNLNAHLRNVHHKMNDKIISFEYSVYNNKCTDCKVSFRQLADLRIHLENVHNANMKMEKIEFTTRTEFFKWYSNMCHTLNVQYTHKINKTIEYYNCNRSGKRENRKTDRQRTPKSQGSCKINFSCTSQIILKQVENKFKVTFYQSHYGHRKDLQHLRISKEDRNMFAAKLSAGVSMKRLLEDTKNDIQKNELKRIDLLSMKDLRNIKTSFNLKTDEGRKHVNDCLSVDLWVEEQKASQNPYVLFYKKQQEEGVMFFRKEDFCLILMNSSQRLVLRNHGSKMITIDSTHGLNLYDFQLTTMMVLDNYGEGFPAACMFSNRQDSYVYEVFFSEVKKCVGIISPFSFMSDITEVFYNAWFKVMGRPTHRLFCSWHVDRAWQVNIKKIKNTEKRNWVYQTVKVLQTTLNEIEFTNLLNTYTDLFIKDNDTQDFGLYFKKYYYSTAKMWAYCFRKSCGISTDMHVESMHKVIKCFYLEGKNVQKLNKGLHAVVGFIRDKIIDRIIKGTIGKNNRYIQKITDRHRVSLSISVTIEKLEERIYKVNNEENAYIIRKLLDNPCCKLTCQNCNICVHSFSCQCADYYIHHTICKHIHYLCNSEKKIPVRNFENNNVDLSANLETSTHLASLANTAQFKNEECLLKTKKNIDILLQNINKRSEFFLKNNDQESLEQIHIKLKEVITLSTLLDNKIETFPEVIKEHGNKRINKQISFVTTKRRKIKNSLLKKPSKEDCDLIKFSPCI